MPQGGFTSLQYEIYPLGEHAVTVRWSTGIDREAHRLVLALHEDLENNRFDGLVEGVPAYSAFTVYYDPHVVYRQTRQSPYVAVCELLEKRIAALTPSSLSRSRRVEIPVCYDPEFALDLPFVAQHSGLTEEEVIRIHTSPVYRVTMIGFVPGFPYLEGMDERIAVPRKTTPRGLVHKGSVGIGGKQTGVYPLEIPGGWQIIGRTPLSLFDPLKHPPALLRAGDNVVFYRIDKTEYEHMQEERKGSLE